MSVIPLPCANKLKMRERCPRTRLRKAKFAVEA